MSSQSCMCSTKKFIENMNGRNTKPIGVKNITEMNWKQPKQNKPNENKKTIKNKKGLLTGLFSAQTTNVTRKGISRFWNRHWIQAAFFGWVKILWSPNLKKKKKGKKVATITRRITLRTKTKMKTKQNKTKQNKKKKIIKHKKERKKEWMNE